MIMKLKIETFSIFMIFLKCSAKEPRIYSFVEQSAISHYNTSRSLGWGAFLELWHFENSRLDRIYSSQNLNIIDSKILLFQYSDHDALLAEFLLRLRTRGPGYWKLNTSILDQENFRIASQILWQ